MKVSGWLILIIAGLVALMFVLVAHFAHAQDGHTHEGALGKYYSTWMMPDNPAVSCCSNQDCSPAASKFENGKWYAERDGIWHAIPENKIERERDSPDGRSHLCGRIGYSGQFTPFCFVRGNGA